MRASYLVTRQRNGLRPGGQGVSRTGRRRAVHAISSTLSMPAGQRIQGPRASERDRMIIRAALTRDEKPEYYGHCQTAESSTSRTLYTAGSCAGPVARVDRRAWGAVGCQMAEPPHGGHSLSQTDHEALAQDWCAQEPQPQPQPQPQPLTAASSDIWSGATVAVEEGRSSATARVAVLRPAVRPQT
jgi:hypothetical protein